MNGIQGTKPAGRQWNILLDAAVTILQYKKSTIDHAIYIKVFDDDTHRFTARILDVSNAFQNTNVPIHEIVCVSPPPYYHDWFEISYPNVPLNRDDGPFCLQCMNGIQGTKPAGRQCNRLLDAVVKILE